LRKEKWGSTGVLQEKTVYRGSIGEKAFYRKKKFYRGSTGEKGIIDDRGGAGSVPPR